jgi:hypothetical protein
MRFGSHLIVMGIPNAAVGVGDIDVDVVVFAGLEPRGRYLEQGASDKSSEVVADRNGTVSVPTSAGQSSGIRVFRGKGRNR